MAYQQITSFQNARVKQVKKLRDRRGREREGRFVIDDGRDLERALDQGYEVDYVLFCPEIASDYTHLLDTLPESRIYTLPAEIMQKASYRDNPSALVAVMIARGTRGVQALDDFNGRSVLVLVDLRKPGNIGALLRTADAAGFDAVFLVDLALDLHNPNIIRSSTGACFLDNVYELTTSDALTYLQSHQFDIMAAVVEGDRELYGLDLGEQTAVVLGTEDVGLDTIWREAATYQVRIPMRGRIADSLNVSVSGALFMYEVLRQAGKQKY
jgi:TrmH family RNA methyltransferase